MAGYRRWRPVVTVATVWIIGAWYMLWHPTADGIFDSPDTPATHPLQAGENTQWRKLPERFPVSTLASLPTGKPTVKIPRVQVPRPKESPAERKLRQQKLAAVKASFQHSWNGYKTHAWLRDEVTPISGKSRDPFGGWAATLVDAMDTLWIMGMKDDFAAAVKASGSIDFTTSEGRQINVFETTIRYLGGFLAGYELSGMKYRILLKKAVEVGELLMCAFDTPNRMPITRWDWAEYSRGTPQMAPEQMLVSEIGSLSLEFTKLSALTGDMKYYDAVQRISAEFDRIQNSTRLPGMWPVIIDASAFIAQHNGFTLGGMSDSLYEYLPKQFMLLNGRLSQPRKMYEEFIEVAKKHLFTPALNPQNAQILISGDLNVERDDNGGEKFSAVHRGQHLTCFTGGMVGIASRIFDRPVDLDVARQLTNGCVWAYNSTISGIGPEVFSFVPCNKVGASTESSKCEWSEKKWRAALREKWLAGGGGEGAGEVQDIQDHISGIVETHRIPLGMVSVDDTRYILRPEAIESVFIMYRLTGEREWMDKAWGMWERIDKHTRTDIAAAALDDVTKERPERSDSMESFWLAETLKYFYLVFSDWDVVNLDEWVLNTEAHPLRRIT